MIIHPDLYLNKVEEITAEYLNLKEIKALILDVDNTLIDYNKNLSETIVKWAEDIKKQGIKLYILSNSNKKDKVKTVADKLGIEFDYFAKKPLKFGFKKVQRKINMPEQNIGVVGDQIFTDIIGGNRCKMFTILVDPINSKDFWFTAWKRPIEDKIKNKIEKRIEIGDKDVF